MVHDEDAVVRAAGEVVEPDRDIDAVPAADHAASERADEFEDRDVEGPAGEETEYPRDQEKRRGQNAVEHDADDHVRVDDQGEHSFACSGCVAAGKGAVYLPDSCCAACAAAFAASACAVSIAWFFSKKS